MRSIKLKMDDAFNERAQLRAAVAGAPERGYTIEDVRNALKVIERIDAMSDDTLLLEDSNWEFLCEQIRAKRWLVATAEVLAMIDKVLGARQVPEDSLRVVG